MFNVQLKNNWHVVLGDDGINVSLNTWFSTM